MAVIGPQEGNGGGKLKQAGDYACIVESMTRKSGRAGDYFETVLRIIGRCDGRGGLDVSCAKSYSFVNLSLSDKASWKLGRLAWCIRRKKGETVDTDDDNAVRAYFRDRECVLTFAVESHETYGDKAVWEGDGRQITKPEYAAVKAVYEAEGSAHKAAWRPTEDDSGFGGGSGGSSGSSGAGDADPDDDDDIPF